MFDTLREKFDNVVRLLKRTGKIREENITEALKSIKLALLEADVNYKVVKDFLENVKTKSLGEKVLKSVTPAQQFIKIVYDEIVELIKSEKIIIPKTLPPNRVNKILLFGLNGSGKTTSTIKLAKFMKNMKPIIIAADIHRPAAIDQLIQLGKKYNIDIFYDKESKNPVKIVKAGLKYADKNSYNLAIIDTAGRLEIDEELMDELKAIEKEAKPHYNFMVIDSLTGQQGINVLLKFKENISKIDGVILTKFDSDTRGGIVLSLKYLTDISILFIGTGEGIDDFEKFIPERIAKKILGMYDVVELVEKVEQYKNEEELEKLAKKFKTNNFDLNDFLEQMKSMMNNGIMKQLANFLPMKIPTDQLMDKKKFKHIEAIILSMTKEERTMPEIINLSRKLRISKGAGRPIGEVSKLLEQFNQTRKMMKKVKKMNKNKMVMDPTQLLKQLQV